MKLAKQFLAIMPVLGAALLASCAQIGYQPVAAPGNVSHVVLVWLKRPGDASERARVIEAAKDFRGRIPGLLAMSIGEPLPSPRPVVDSSFDVGIAMRFETPHALEAYEKNPIHQKAVKEVLAPLSAKIVVYDWTVQ
jgi:hypothetical protein